jgi:dTDP-glucose 4,6-dehydratase
MKRIMVTGASGLMGAHVVRHILATTDYNSIVLPVTYKHRGVQDRINYILESIPMALSRIKLVPVDLAQPLSPVTYAKFGKVDYVINCASESHVNRSIENPTPFILNNVSLMCHMLDWARETGVEKFLHISTDEVYGPGSKHRTNKEWKDLHLPSNPYAASKAAQEDIALSYWRTYGMPIAIVNSMNIIGETQDSEKYMALVMKKIYNNEKVTVHSNGGEIGSRYYLHARSLASGLMHILEQNFPKYGEAELPLRMHIAGEKKLNNLELAQLVAQAAGKQLNYELVDPNTERPGHDMHYALSGDNLARSGWTHPMAIEESIDRVVRWTYEHPEWLDI